MSDPREQPRGDHIKIEIGDNAKNVAAGKNVQQTTNHVTHLHQVIVGHLSSLQIAVSVIVAVVLGLVSNIIAAYLQQQYDLINNTGRFIVVLAVFVISLVLSIILSLRSSKTGDHSE